MSDDGTLNTGVPASPSGHSAEPEPISVVSAVPVSVPNAALALAARCEEAQGADRSLDYEIVRAVGWADDIPYSREHDGWREPRDFTASFDSALTLLSAKNDWRRLTPTSISVYAGSPYNAAAQVRYDGYGATLPLQLCAAFLKMRGAAEAKASAVEARRAATAETGAVHEGVGRRHRPHVPIIPQKESRP